ncbi:MAG TPA: 2-hydroxyacyl-CoA dehydratase family protein [Trebonia sp.]|nr:2-hydroxyacyl-CoA dehydratase family protein [Trebonia sp.]
MAEQAGARRRPELACTQRFTRYQRDWFAGVRARAAAGEPVALLSADSPHEIYRAMDIPYVVIQWWSSVIAAKQKAPRYLRALAEAGFPDDSEQYNSLPFGGLLAADDDPPWGGLPRPAIISASLSTDAMRQLFEAWAERSGAAFYPVEKTVDPRPDLPERWWAELPRSWDRFLPAERLDLLTDELTGLIRVLEQTTGRRFSETRFAEVMQLANEQAEHNAAARDLVAATVPAPVSIAETMPAVMVPQWHRGSTWARDAAAEFHAELDQRVADGAAACPGERVRLMWLGRGLWSSLGLYQHFQDTYGAVFVWSMYLGLAADGYARYFDGRDPLRALAARFVTVGDELRMPSWSAAWHVQQARQHQIDGVVSLGEDDYFSVRRLEAAGIPVLSIAADNVDRRTWTEDHLQAAIARFIEDRALPAAERRHHAS